MTPRTHFLPLVERVRRLPALPAAIVFPCDRESLQLASSGAFTGTLAPRLVGPEIRIRDVAGHAGIDIAGLPIEDTADSPRAAAYRAAALARDGHVVALVQGSLHTDELLAPLADPDSGLRRVGRLSHAYFADLPGQDHGMLLADAHLNVVPDLAAKVEIVRNTIALAHALGVVKPRVAILAAVDNVTSAFPSTEDAAALVSLAARGAFGEAIVDGPLAADSALLALAARANGRESPVAGQADVLIAPDMESALLVLRTLVGITGGLAAGLLLGANLPVVAPQPSDTMEVRMASCVLATLWAAALADAAQREASAAGEPPSAPADAHAIA